MISVSFYRNQFGAHIDTNLMGFGFRICCEAMVEATALSASVICDTSDSWLTVISNQNVRTN